MPAPLAVIMDRRTDAPLKPGSELLGHYGHAEWKYERMHTFPNADGTGAMLSCRDIASGRKATIAAASFGRVCR